jgi:two-component system NtrC family sensor kinase
VLIHMNENLTSTEAGQVTAGQGDPAATPASSAAAPVILIVDDDDDIREILRRLLNREPYTLIEAENGIAALAACQRSPVDLILLDIMMPLMDGLTTCAKIRELPGYEHIPILMLTVLKDTVAINRAFEAGATDYLTKPIDPTILRPRVKHLLRVTQAEIRVRASEQKLRSFVEQASDGFMLTDEYGRIIEWNRSMEQITGYTRAETLGQWIWDVQQQLTADDWKDHEEYQRLLTTQRAVYQAGAADVLNQLVEIVFQHRDGSRRIVQQAVFPIVTEQGRSWLGSSVRDLTRQRQIAEDLAQRARELAALGNASRALTSSLELKQVLAAIIREIQDLLKADRAAVLLREATSDDLVFAAAAGENSEKLIGTHLAIDRGIAGWVARERQSALVTEAYQDPRFWGSSDAQTGYLTRSVVAVPIKYRGAVWGVIEAINKRDGVFSERDRDMLEALAGSAAIALENARLYQAEREQTHRLKESQARLIHSEKMSALGRLVASLTHEINNPLQALRSGLTLIQAELKEGADPAGVLHDLQIIDQEVKRISDLMLRLREFSRPVQLDTSPTDLHALLDTILNLTSKQMQRHHIQVGRHWDPAVPVIMASPDQLTQVIMNLVLNAIDVMPGGGALTISTSADRSRADFPIIRIKVSDTGLGIPPEVLPRIFEPFFTTKEDGTGLGLAISFEIVKSLGGEITVASQPGTGTTFAVVLPLRES